MLITECPWCEGAATVTDTVDCEACGVQVELSDLEDLALAA